MARIFISYSRGERPVAERLAERLTEEGYDVWWDAAILGGTRFEDEIADVLRKADVAIILWSKGAAGSDWVRAEAEIARVNRTALPVIIDDVEITALPILFQQIHTIDLRNWDGNPATGGYQQLLKSIGSRAGMARGPKLTTGQAETRIGQEDIEAAAWAELNAAKDVLPDDYLAFLKRFGPDGEHATLAQMRLERLARRARRRRRLTVGAVAVVALLAVGGVADLLRPDLLDPIYSLFRGDSAPSCRPEDVVKSPTGPFALCLDERTWVATQQPDDTVISRQTRDGQTMLFLRTGQLTPDPDDRLKLIVQESDGQTSTVGTTEVLDKSTVQIGGRTWHVWKYRRPRQNDSERNLVYYYVQSGYGFVELTFYSPQSRFDALAPYAEEIIKAASFQ